MDESIVEDSIFLLRNYLLILALSMQIVFSYLNY